MYCNVPTFFVLQAWFTKTVTRPTVVVITVTYITFVMWIWVVSLFLSFVLVARVWNESDACVCLIKTLWPTLEIQPWHGWHSLWLVSFFLSFFLHQMMVQLFVFCTVLGKGKDKIPLSSTLRQFGEYCVRPVFSMALGTWKCDIIIITPGRFTFSNTKKITK